MFAMAAAQVRKCLEVAKKFRAEGFGELLLCVYVCNFLEDTPYSLVVSWGGGGILFILLCITFQHMIVWPHLLCQNTGYSLM